MDAAHVARSITIEIDAPASLVWEILTDLRNYNDWNPLGVRAHVGPLNVHVES